MAAKTQLTQKEYESYQKEYNYLKNDKTTEVSLKLKEAISYGDISENAEYDSAKNEQAELVQRISEIEFLLKNCEIVKNISIEQVNVGTIVTLKNLNTKEIEEFEIVGKNADIFSVPMKITLDALLGLHIKDRKVGEKVEFNTPTGLCKYEILDIRSAR